MKQYLITYFNKNSHDTVIFFRRVLYIVLLFDALFTMPYIHDFYAPNGFTPFQIYPGFINYWFNILSYPPFYNFYLYVYGVFIVLLSIQIFKDITAFGHILVYIIFKIFCFKTSEMLNAGHDLMGIVLFFNIFLSSNSSSIYKKWMSNAGIFAIKIQLCILYFFSFLFKLNGDEWINGSALFLVIQNDGYTLPHLKQFFTQNHIFLKTLNYLTLIYQGVFPVLIWFKKFRNVLLVVGVVFHAGILMFTGLYDFALFVMATYSIFYQSKEVEN